MQKHEAILLKVLVAEGGNFEPYEGSWHKQVIAWGLAIAGCIGAAIGYRQSAGTGVASHGRA